VSESEIKIEKDGGSVEKRERARKKAWNGKRGRVVKWCDHPSSIEDTRDRDVLRNGDKNPLSDTLRE